MLTVLHISNREKLWISENGGRKVERNSVFPQVRSRLGFVPLEFKLRVIQTQFSHIAAPPATKVRGVRVWA